MEQTIIEPGQYPEIEDFAKVAGVSVEDTLKVLDTCRWKATVSGAFEFAERTSPDDEESEALTARVDEIFNGDNEEGGQHAYGCGWEAVVQAFGWEILEELDEYKERTAGEEGEAV